MQRLPTGRVIAFNAILWGVLTMCMASTNTFAGFAVCRFLLGLFEALTFPGFAMVVGTWYTRQEQILRIALLYSTLSSFNNGILSCESNPA